MRRGVLIAAALGALIVPASANAVDYAPVDRPGPALSVPQADLDAALECAGSVTSAAVTPVLLVPGTGSDPDHNFSWNWEPALDALGIPWCTVALPGNGMGDIQISGEYVVNAIRSMYQRAGRKISIIGHSQGGMIPRWPFRFWPDTRVMVDDQIGLAPSNHGTDGANTVCNPDCSPAFWQQASGSEFVKALNSFQETFAGISYTEVYTHTDWVVTPNQDAQTGSSSLRTGDGQITNVAIQDICPTDLNEHLQIGTVDNVAYSLAIDALTHPGPADPSRIDPTSVCAQPFMPGVNPLTAAGDEADAGAALGQTIASYPHVPAEPALRCYTLASCGAAASGNQPSARSAAGRCRKKQRRHGRAHHSKRSSCKKHKKHRRH